MPTLPWITPSSLASRLPDPFPGLPHRTARRRAPPPALTAVLTMVLGPLLSVFPARPHAVPGGESGGSARVEGPWVTTPATGLAAQETESTTPTGTDGQEPTSSLIRELEREVRAGDSGTAVEDFWAAVIQRGTPLIEGAGPGRSVVTFVFRGGDEVTDVRMQSGLLALEVQAAGEEFGEVFDTLGGMTHVPSTDVWHRSYRVANDLRAPYTFAVRRAGEAEPIRELDPLNSATYDPHERFRPESVVELPGAPPQPWRDARGEGPGRWHRIPVAVRSAAKGHPAGDSNGRPADDPGGDATLDVVIDTAVVYAYTPEAYDPEREEAYPLFLGLGSYTFGIAMGGDWIVEHLIRTGEIEPTVMVLVELDRDMERDAYQPMVDFLAEDVLPTIRRELHLTDDPARIIIGGTSRRGLVSGIMAFRRPDLVGNVIALSGSFHWKPRGAVEYEWMTSRVAAAPARDIRWFLRAGSLETVVTPGNHGHYMVATNRHMRDVLRARGYDLDYAEFTGVHSDLNWQSGLADGLRRFFGR